MRGFKYSKISIDGRNANCWLAESDICVDLPAFIAKIEDHLSSAKILKDSRSVKAGISSFKGRNLFVKRYNDRGLAYRIRYMFKAPRPVNVLRVFSHLKSKAVGFRIPEYFGAVYGASICGAQSYTIQEAIEDSVSAFDVCRLAFASDGGKENLAWRLCETLSNMHRAGIAHMDPKLSNFIFTGAPDDFSCGMWDFDVSKIRNRISLPERERELARTASSFVDLGNRL